MITSIPEIPELVNLDALEYVIRIPDAVDVPVTGRVRKLIDTPEFHRLASISQLGLVSLVYPAANHTRFEHSLGVYRMALIYAKQLSRFDRFHELVTPEDVEIFIVAALLHDLGHWPFCHPIEDLELAGVPEHEHFANSFLLEGEVANTLRDDWGIHPREVVNFLSGKPRTRSRELLQSLLSGPIDVDKVDYLQRDSLHAGVPYGRNFDVQRLVASLCINQQGNRLAISEKGKTAAEMMVFSRYVMFSEVYWHHAVRSATSMLHRLFYLLEPELDLDQLFRLTEQPFIDILCGNAREHSLSDLAEGIFGNQRSLYKRLLEITFQNRPELYRKLAHQDYGFLASCSELFATRLSQRFGFRVAPDQVLIDAPPKGHETQFKVDVISTRSNNSVPLEDLSPVVSAMSSQIFDWQVKPVRVFIHPDVRSRLDANEDYVNLLTDVLQSMG